MTLIQIILIGIGLAMDAVCVSMTNGMCFKVKFKQAVFISLTFGIFQGVMPLIGYFAGCIFTKQITAIDHWIALILLSIIGGKMLFDTIKNKDNAECNAQKISYKLIFIQGIATSIDALAVGVSFAACRINIFSSCFIIAFTTFILSLFSIFLGEKIGTKLNTKAGIFGGLILIFIGIKIFIDGI
ncbi:MAG: manganese efflux pump MntP family protein [Oscillospiraceae bacterium]